MSGCGCGPYYERPAKQVNRPLAIPSSTFRRPLSTSNPPLIHTRYSYTFTKESILLPSSQSLSRYNNYEDEDDDDNHSSSSLSSFADDAVFSSTSRGSIAFENSDSFCGRPPSRCSSASSYMDNTIPSHSYVSVGPSSNSTIASNSSRRSNRSAYYDDTYTNSYYNNSCCGGCSSNH